MQGSRKRPPKSPKVRLDQLVHQQGLAETSERARALIMAGRVRVGGQVMDKPGAPVGEDVAVTVEIGLPFVGRGGLKLAHALDHFHVDVGGWSALDVGASTGGFTDCMLQRGAVHVAALDVGRGQLDYRLRQDPRVEVMERVNAHYPFEVSGPVEIAVVDVSFISLTMVLPNVVPHVRPNGVFLCLVKPQFEAAREQMERGGVIKDPMTHGAVLGKVALWAIGAGLRFLGITNSPVLGDAGNREFFILLRKEPDDL